MENHAADVRLPKAPEPYWLNALDIPTFEPLQEDIKVDVVVVGGGITGITTAYLLVQEGISVALLEADRLLNGTTGHTTAKLTAQHGLFYDELMAHMGRTQARLYFEANDEAIQFVERTVSALGVDCDFQRQDAYVYAVAAESANKVEQEFEAYQTLGIDGELVAEIPFDLQIKQAIVMKNQAQFHPTRYLAGLVKALQDKGCRIFEGTTAVDVEYDDEPVVVTRDGYKVQADKVISCSHYPFYDGLGFYFARLHAERAYVIAGRSDKPYPGGMYISADNPTRSIRATNMNGEPLVLISGDGHKTGQGKDTLAHYEALEAFGQEVLWLQEVLYRWSAQDLYTLDKVAYIGPLTAGKPNVLVATGYRKWGMTTGTQAALLLRDYALDKDNPYKELYAPSRFYADPSLKTFLVQNANVAAHLVKGKFEMPARQAEDLANGEGGVVNHQGARNGAYRDEDGKLFVVDTTCTHMGCEVTWNHGDKTWDCPCHGSRFTYKGDVMEGPAERSLKRLD